MWGLSAIRLSVVADDSAAVREPYDGDGDHYQCHRFQPGGPDPVVQCRPATADTGRRQLHLPAPPAAQTATPELDPGQSLSLHAILYPDLSGDLEPYLSFVTEKMVDGMVDQSAIITGQPVQGGRLTATGTSISGGVKLTWQAVPGATGYEIWSTAAWPNPIPNPPYLTLTQFSGSPQATVGAVTQANVTGQIGTNEYAIIPLFNGTPGDVQTPLVRATAGPSITRFTPASGPPGKTVTITGTNLLGATKVTFNGVAGTIVSDTATTIKVKVPVGAKTGKIKVKTPGGTATSATNFTVT